VEGEVTYPAIRSHCFLTLHNVHYRLSKYVGCNLVLVKRILTAMTLASLMVLASSAVSFGARAHSGIVLSFDFSQNTASPTTNQPYVVVVDVTPKSSGGLVTVAAQKVPIRTSTSNSSTIVGCSSQAVVGGQVSCTLRFTTTGRWRISAELQGNRVTRNVIRSSTSLQVFGSA
jgi:hypothetical protein